MFQKLTKYTSHEHLPLPTKLPQYVPKKVNGMVYGLLGFKQPSDVS